ncbi:F-box protein At5g07610-like [Bidens hawaiensis]|uniref:F-box protein At5g07610-like n=1 Tax=Bidens hawaiensis TaxID=980011 RepID=UPI00404979A2
MRDHRKYYVFNPTTKQFQVIQSIIGGLRARKALCFMGLAFHQTDRVHYKLVCVLGLKRNTDLHQIQIYSSETRKWKIAVESFSACGRVFKNGVYLNGAVYWAPIDGHYSCFKIDDEKLHMLSLPEELIPFNRWTMYFGESRGHMHLILRVNHQKNSFLVYEMLRDHSGWFVKYEVHLDELRATFSKIGCQNSGYDFKVIDMVRGETEEDTFMVLNTMEKIITYNVHDKSFKLIFTLPKNSEYFFI